MQFDYTCKSLHFSWALSTCPSHWKLLLPSSVTASLFHTFVFIPCMGRQNHPASVYLVASALFGFYSYSTAQFQLDYYTRVTNARLYTFFRLLDACMRVHLRSMTYECS